MPRKSVSEPAWNRWVETNNQLSDHFFLMTQQFMCLANNLLPIRLTATLIKKFSEWNEQSKTFKCPHEFRAQILQCHQFINPFNIFLSTTLKNANATSPFVRQKFEFHYSCCPAVLKALNQRSKFKLSRNCFCPPTLAGIIRLNPSKEIPFSLIYQTNCFATRSVCFRCLYSHTNP